METDDVASGDCMTGLLQLLSLAVCSCHMTRERNWHQKMRMHNQNQDTTNVPILSHICDVCVKYIF